jgi:hypothetical protein
MSAEGPDDDPDEEEPMKYMLFITADPTAPMPGKIGDIYEWLDSVKNVRLHGDRLQGAATATCVRSRNGRQVVTDGPFAETKEQIGGYDVIDCADLDEAIEIAARHPVAAWGTVEIRPFWTD